MTKCVSIMMSDIVPLRERGTWQGKWPMTPIFFTRFSLSAG
jgi:hypothetical protein